MREYVLHQPSDTNIIDWRFRAMTGKVEGPSPVGYDLGPHVAVQSDRMKKQELRIRFSGVSISTHGYSLFIANHP
jgi:hypothetical protein